MSFEIEKNLIKKTIGEDVYGLLKDTKCILAGGAITSIFSGTEVMDYDFEEKCTAVQLEDVVKEWTKPVEAAVAPVKAAPPVVDFDDIF